MTDMRQLNADVINQFRANAGVLSGPMAGAPILLATTTGRRSGNRFTTPLGFIDDDGSVVVAAANGGADQHPQWYQNLMADPQLTVEIGAASIEATAATAEGPERDRLMAALCQTLPGMADYVAATDRHIPVVRLTEIAAD